MNTTSRLAVLVSAVTLLAGQACGGVDPIVTVIDFEEFPEGTPISTQYSVFGVTFVLDGRPGEYPIIAREGQPAVAFGTPAADGNMSSGLAGLTDPVVGGDLAVPADVRINFDPPVSRVSFYLVDLDLFAGAPESIAVRAFSGDTEVDLESLVGVAANDGKSVPVVVEAPSISSVLIDLTASTGGGIGWALDFLTISRPCPSPDCTPRLRLSQESSPGAGDFLDHLVGEVIMWEAPGTSASAFYGYGVPEGSSWNGAALVPVADRSHLFAAVTTDGPTVFMVHDRALPDDPDGGRAETRVEVFNDPSGARFVAQDGPASGPTGTDVDFYTGEPGAAEFAARHGWNQCCTDGFALGDLGCGSTLIVAFTDVDRDPGTPTIEGLTGWMAYGADGATLPLALVADRRVRIDLLPPASCPADFTCDGVVDGADLGILLAAWNSAGGAPDMDGSGTVDGADLGLLLGWWGACRSS